MIDQAFMILDMLIISAAIFLIVYAIIRAKNERGIAIFLVVFLSLMSMILLSVPAMLTNQPDLFQLMEKKICQKWGVGCDCGRRMLKP